MRRRSATLLVGVLGLLAAGCLPPSPPPLENGRLPDSMLTTITPQCRVVNEVAPQLTALLQAANEQGVALPQLRDAGVVAELLLLHRCVRRRGGAGHERARLGTSGRLRGSGSGVE